MVLSKRHPITLPTDRGGFKVKIDGWQFRWIGPELCRDLQFLAFFAPEINQMSARFFVVSVVFVHCADSRD